MGRQRGSSDHSNMSLGQRIWAKSMSYLDRSRVVSSGLGHLRRLHICHPQGTDYLKLGDAGETPDPSKTWRVLGADSSPIRNFWYAPEKVLVSWAVSPGVTPSSPV